MPRQRTTVPDAATREIAAQAKLGDRSAIATGACVRRTIIVADSVAADARRLGLARVRAHGTQVWTVGQVAARLAGGFLGPIDGDVLAQAAASAIVAVPAAELGELGAIAGLPGVPGALVSTLQKVWNAGIDLTTEAAAEPHAGRLAVLARLEAAVLALLPPTMLTPGAMVTRALARLVHAPAVLGAVSCDRLLHVAPCWHLLLDALVPDWRGALALPDATPVPLRVVSAATARHEVIEALRWARGLLAGGTVQAQDIAFAAASPGEYDDLLQAIGAEANLPVHFAQGRRALTTRDGQATAALADILLRGLSQDRVRRLARLAHDKATPFGQAPDDWHRQLPRAAPLASPERWEAALAGTDAEAPLLPALRLLAGGVAQAQAAGDLLLRGSARALWRAALHRAPASAIEATLGAMRVPDETEPWTSILWLPASMLATCPRPYIWLLGLNARAWPRAASEDPLLPDHLLPIARLDPVPVTMLDRRAFAAIRASTTGSLVCSASRRDATGRLMGLSPLLPPSAPVERLRRARIPAHAMSEQDRMMARPTEFALTPRARSAAACWIDWNDPGITAHDGQVRADHPMLSRALGRIHSATSLKLLLRNPLGFAWTYALGWREPDRAEAAMDLDAMQFGNLVHAVLEAAMPTISVAGGLGSAGAAAVGAAVADALAVIAARWEAEQPVPPALLWRLRLDEAAGLATIALGWRLDAYAGQQSYAELAFGDPRATGAVAPWDAARPITIPGTDLRIQGRIDRLDLSGDGTKARVVDYKTGTARDPGTLKGGAELQRCLYAYAVRDLLGDDVAVEAALLYPRGTDTYYPLADTGATLSVLTEALLAARASLLAGRALPGADTGSTYDALAFALPASPGAPTARKRLAAAAELGDAARIWDQA